MKTPREILFARHRQVEPQLDEVRRKALAATGMSGNTGPMRTGRGPERSARTPLAQIWLELIWPSRHAWAAMAVIWLAVLAANLQMKATVRIVPSKSSAPTGELAQAIEAQRRLLTELLQTVNTPSVAPPRPTPRPRSERPAALRAC